MALERLTYDRAAKAVTYRSDKSEGPTAGTETADPLECLARVLVHIPDKGHETTRYSGWSANRPRGMRRQAEPAAASERTVIVPAPRLTATEATRRWAALLQQIFEVDPLACPTCQGTMRIVAFITQASVIDQILVHLRTRATREAHAGPRSPPSPGRVARAARPRPRRRSNRPLRTAPTPRHHAGTCGVGVSPTGASDWAPPASPPQGPPSHGPRGGPAGRRARRRPAVGARAVGDLFVYSTQPD